MGESRANIARPNESSGPVEPAPRSPQNRVPGKLVAVCAIGAVGGFLFGYDTSVINGAVDAIASPDSGFALTSVMSGLSVSTALLGCVFGAWFAGAVADRLGRIRVLELAALLFVVSSLVVGLTSSFPVFVLFRIVGGLGVGFTSAIGPAYIAEISPAAKRGFFTSFQQMAIALGIIASLIVNDAYAISSGGAAQPFWLGLDAWRWMLITTAVPGVIMFFLCLTLPETPRYLVMKGRIDEARKILTDVCGDQDADATITKIDSSFQGADNAGFGELRGKTFGLKKVMWIAIVFVLLAQANGQNIIMLYDSSLWRMLGFSEQASLSIAVIRAVLAAVATAVGMLLIDRVGRRALMKYGTIGMTAFLAIVAVGFSQGQLMPDGTLTLPVSWAWISIICTYAFFLVCCATTNVAVWVIISEIFPNRIRAKGEAVATAANWMFNFAITTMYPPMRDGIGLGATYGFYALMALLGVVFVIKFLPETGGVELEDMKAE
ncbi:sugar porter family MFS transporter [Bifidobacterium eulemuris]|uniref:MFS transporter n=1 Tax=Bifidobacterium eulemuris TaxID=1765219 RepID=A0A261G1H3_9BIFI|nr:sugar porter family MFS transporter [Bifidobacterium eulemuris]OZG65281.1 MFS transporter [Bifidobacterium eulemuris]QOL32304.1 sugar porter family MFS transporter [Bifidobacterium eulemuris]